jgi:hypothetical protein
MAESKTTRTGASVAEFLAGVADPRRREDSVAACALMAEVTGAEPVMWGPAIVGFGAYQYKYSSGRSGDWPAVSMSPRKAALVVYVSTKDRPDLLERLGPHKVSGSCLHVKRWSDIDPAVLGELVTVTFDAYDGKLVTNG